MYSSGWSSSRRRRRDTLGANPGEAYGRRSVVETSFEISYWRKRAEEDDPVSWRHILPGLVCLAWPPATHAQQLAPAAPLDIRCFYASASFSPGASVTIGGVAYVCARDGDYGAWQSSTAPASLSYCIYSSDLYSVGAIEGSADEKFACQPDGSWLAK
jgi:hypothetical protein